MPVCPLRQPRSNLKQISYIKRLHNHNNLFKNVSTNLKMNHKQYYEEIISVMEKLSNNKYETEIEKISDLIVENYKKGGILLICGNGGSAADAQHIVAENIGSYLNRKRKAFPAISLTTNSSNLTSIINDFDFSKIFSRQLQAFDEIGYVLIGISTSGNSENILNAIKYSKSKKKLTIGLTGKSGGKLKSLADYCIKAPSDFTPIIQTAHNTIYHRMCELIERKMVQ